MADPEPTPPKRSLPSYREPTPETHRKLDREQEAELALKNTVISPELSVALIAFLCLTVVTVPLLQFCANPRSLGGLVALDQLTARFHPGGLRSPSAAWDMLPRPDETKKVEKTMQDESVMAKALRPAVQSLITNRLRGGSEQAYLGRGDWLFFRADVDYVIGPGFLHADQLKHRARTSNAVADPFPGIIDFRDQLARRKIELVLVPVPVKPTVEPAEFAQTSHRTIENSSFDEFKARLARENIRAFDIGRVMSTLTAPRYLKADTHWRPEAMQAIARALAAELPNEPRTFTAALDRRDVTALGDVAALLTLPQNQVRRYEETVPIEQVWAGNGAWQADPDADVLLLGDSFSNVFSLGAMHWGESAGFPEHLSAALGRPIDCILRNSDASFATREMLARELGRGRDRLARKKVVVWEFAERELAFGDWRKIDISLRTPPPSQFLTLAAGQPNVVTGTVAALSNVPRPGSAPYADHIMSIHLVDVGRNSSEALVYTWSMRGNHWTNAARLRVGDKATFHLRSWSDVSSELEKINRSELADPRLQLEEPVWGELEQLDHSH
jgi:hypothetical protein